MIDPTTLADPDAERAVIGSAMLDPSMADQCLALLRPEAFARELHRMAWAAVIALRSKNAACDMVAIADEVQRTHAVPDDLLLTLEAALTSVAAPGNAPTHALAVREAATRRALVRAAKAVETAARELTAPLEAVCSQAHSEMATAADEGADTEVPPDLASLIPDAWAYIELVHENPEAGGLNTGIRLLDRCTNGGLHAGELWVLGAPPSEGKSALAEWLSLLIAMRAGRVYYATPEMTRRTVALRAMSAVGGVDLRGLYGQGLGDREWSGLSEAMSKLANRGKSLFVDDRSRSMDAIAAQARRLHSRYPLDLIVIDHLHELSRPTGAKDDTAAVTANVGAAKDLCKALGAPVLLLSQLNRDARRDKRTPAMHDLRGSGAIEQHGDVVILLQRREQEGPPSEMAAVDLHIAKHRNGPTGTVTLIHNRATGRWWDPKDTSAGRAALD